MTASAACLSRSIPIGFMTVWMFLFIAADANKEIQQLHISINRLDDLKQRVNAEQVLLKSAMSYDQFWRP